MCRTALIQSALESHNHRAFNGGLGVEIQPLGTDLVTFELAATNSSEISGEICIN